MSQQAATAPAESPYKNKTSFQPGHLINAKSPAYKQSVAKIREICTEYLDNCTASDRSPTIPGLALALGFPTRTAFHEFLNNNKYIVNGDKTRHRAILDTVKRVKSVIEDIRVSRMVDGKGSTPGAIFDLKNNFGYIDKVEQVQDTHITIEWASSIEPVSVQPIDIVEQLSEKTS